MAQISASHTSLYDQTMHVCAIQIKHFFNIIFTPEKKHSSADQQIEEYDSMLQHPEDTILSAWSCDDGS